MEIIRNAIKNCKVYLKLNWIEDCILSSAGDSETDAKLHVPIVTLSTKDSANLRKHLNEGFKRSAYWDSYEIKPVKVIEQGKNIYELLNDVIKQYDKVRKVSTGYGVDYTTGCLLDYAYFKNNYRLIAVDLSKKKALDAGPKAIQQIVFQGVVRICKRNSKSVVTTPKWLNTVT